MNHQHHLMLRINGLLVEQRHSTVIATQQQCHVDVAGMCKGLSVLLQRRSIDHVGERIGMSPANQVAALPDAAGDFDQKAGDRRLRPAFV